MRYWKAKNGRNKKKKKRLKLKEREEREGGREKGDETRLVDPDE